MNHTVDKWLDAHKEEIVEALQQQIRIPSVKGEASDGAPFGRDVRRSLDEAMKLLGSMGFSVCNMDGYVGYSDFGPADAEMLGIMCHLDVVPEGDGWKYPPFGAEIADGKMYGRGTLDDKGPAIATAYALYAIKECGIPLKRNVRIILGCDEESGWGCMAHYRAHAKMPDMAFSPDAEYPLVNSEKCIFQARYEKKYASTIKVSGGTRPNVVPGTASAYVPLPLGRILPIMEAFMEKSDYPCSASAEGDGTRISVTGLAAHASMPEDGRNAVCALFMLLDRLPLAEDDANMVAGIVDAFGMELHGESIGLDKTDASGRLSLNVGVVDWDENGLNGLVIDVRAPISMKEQELVAAFEKALEKEKVQLVGKSFTDGHYVDPESELVTKLLKVYAERSGEYLPPLAIGGGTYARCLPTAIAFGCERPGAESPVHMPNEYISIDDLMFNAHMMADAILALAAE